MYGTRSSFTISRYLACVRYAGDVSTYSRTHRQRNCSTVSRLGSMNVLFPAAEVCAAAARSASRFVPRTVNVRRSRLPVWGWRPNSRTISHVPFERR